MSLFGSEYDLVTESLFYEVDADGKFKCSLCVHDNFTAKSSIRRHLRAVHREQVYGNETYYPRQATRSVHGKLICTTLTVYLNNPTYCIRAINP